MEQEPTTFELIEPDSSQSTRRAFLRTLATAAAASALLAEEEPAEATETIDTYLDTLSNESKLDKIDFPDEPKELTEEAKDLILAIADYQVSWLKSLGIEGKELNRSRIGQTKRGKERESQKEREALWGKLRTCFPDLQQPTERDYQRALMYDTPRYLAQFGIYAVALPYITFTPDLSRFTRTEVAMSFLQIDHKENEELERDGKKIRRDVIHIKGPLKIVGRDVNPINTVHANAEIRYQNIFIFDYRISEKDIGQNDPDIEQKAKEIQALSQDRIWQPIEESADPRNMSLCLAMIKLWGRTGQIKEPSPEAKRKYIRATIEHETGHLLDDQDPNFRNHFPLSTFTLPLDYLKQRENRDAHSEINATLYGLRYGNNQTQILRDIVTLATREVDQDFTHDQASSWVIDSFVDIIIKNPSKYGIILDPKRTVSPQNQIIAQLDLLLDRKQLFNELIEQAMAIHQSRLDEDFSDEYISYSHFEEKRQAVLAQNRAENKRVMLRWSSLGAMLFSIGGGAILLRKLLQRKSEGIRQREEKGEKRKPKKKK